MSQPTGNPECRGGGADPPAAGATLPRYQLAILAAAVTLVIVWQFCAAPFYLVFALVYAIRLLWLQRVKTPLRARRGPS
jgi:hypothetical protein